VDAVHAAASVEARHRAAGVDVLLAVLPAEAFLADARVFVTTVHAGGAVHARAGLASVGFCWNAPQLKVKICLGN
jgi:mannose-1-phosphate guanylyltransferase